MSASFAISFRGANLASRPKSARAARARTAFDVRADSELRGRTSNANGGRPRSRVAETTDAGDASRPNPAARVFTAAAFGVAALIAPAVASRPAVAAPASASTVAVKETWVSRLNPNLIQLPDTARDKIDEGMRGVGDNIVAVTEGIKKQAQDPWSVEDVWLILVWHWLETRGRRMAFDPFEGLTRDPKLDSDAKDADYKDSIWGWLRGPMRAIKYTWIILYLHDNISRMFPSVGVFEGGYFGYAFDLGMYTLCAGTVTIMGISRWLPRMLENRVGIADASLQTVLTRLCTILVGIITVLRAGLLFGVPPGSILGVGGVGGLTFGLAARDVLSNIMGGTMLAFLRPFKVGEEIFVTQGSNFRGSHDPTVSDYLVREIGWYQTTLEAKDTKPTIVPNGYFLGANVINVTRAKARVLILEFRVLFQDRKMIPAICEEIESYLRASKHIDSRRFPVRVNFTSVKSDHLCIGVETHLFKIPLSKHLKTKGKLMMDMLDIAEKHTTGPAYPTEISIEHSLVKFPPKHGQE